MSCPNRAERISLSALQTIVVLSRHSGMMAMRDWLVFNAREADEVARLRIIDPQGFERARLIAERSPMTIQEAYRAVTYDYDHHADAALYARFNVKRGRSLFGRWRDLRVALRMVIR